MNEELQKKLVEILNAAQAAGKEAFLFSKDQVPDILQQLLKWKLAEALFLVLLGLAFAVAAYKFYRVLLKGFKDREEGLVALGLIGGITSSISAFLLILLNAPAALQIWLAPKVYLLEYAANLINK